MNGSDRRWELQALATGDAFKPVTPDAHDRLNELERLMNQLNGQYKSPTPATDRARSFIPLLALIVILALVVGFIVGRVW